MDFRHSPILDRKLKRLIPLDKLQSERSAIIDAIFRTSPVCQAPPAYHKSCDILCDILGRKAVIWNDVRHYIIAPGITLWQAAILEENFFVKRTGVEDGFSNTYNDVITLIAKTRKAAGLD